MAGSAVVRWRCNGWQAGAGTHAAATSSQWQGAFHQLGAKADEEVRPATPDDSDVTRCWLWVAARICGLPNFSPLNLSGLLYGLMRAGGASSPAG